MDDNGQCHIADTFGHARLLMIRISAHGKKNVYNKIYNNWNSIIKNNGNATIQKTSMTSMYMCHGDITSVSKLEKRIVNCLGCNSADVFIVLTYPVFFQKTPNVVVK